MFLQSNKLVLSTASTTLVGPAALRHMDAAPSIKLLRAKDIRPTPETRLVCLNSDVVKVFIIEASFTHSRILCDEDSEDTAYRNK